MRLIKARENSIARILAPSSYEAERVITKVEYNRIERKRMARTEVVALTATIASAKVRGLIKFGSTPKGGGTEGIIAGLMPGGSEKAILRSRVRE